MSEQKDINQDFYIVAREPGAEHPALPTWANRRGNPAGLAASPTADITRVDIPEVPGAFQLRNVFSAGECRRLIELTESLGYLEDAPVSLPRQVRHNDNVTWVVDSDTDGLIWQRVSHLFGDPQKIYDGKAALGINARFRFYRYGVGDFFKPHIDGAWPGSRVVDEQLITNAYPDRWSQMTFLILLSEDFDGGATQFWVDKENSGLPARHESRANKVDIRTPAGSVLCFPHGHHPLHCLHSSEPIRSGTKYIIRTDVLFEL